MKYIVNIKEVHNLPVEIEANSPQEAKEKVADMLANDDGSINFDLLEYSYTEDVEDWNVEKVS